MITVKELIEKLEKMPQDLPVVDCMFGLVDGNVKVINGYPLGDPCRPGGCPETRAVYIE